MKEQKLCQYCKCLIYIVLKFWTLFGVVHIRTDIVRKRTFREQVVYKISSYRLYNLFLRNKTAYLFLEINVLTGMPVDYEISLNGMPSSSVSSKTARCSSGSSSNACSNSSQTVERI